MIVYLDSISTYNVQEAQLTNIYSVKKFIVDHFLFGDGSALQNDTSFLEKGIIDSTGFLEVVSFLEETYSITVEDDELLPENFECLNNIDQFLQKKLDAKSSAV